MDNKRFAELCGIYEHDDSLCQCGIDRAHHSFETHPFTPFSVVPLPDFAADPRLVLWIMRERPDFQDFYKFIGSYYCREFHAWMHDERLILDKTGKLRDRAVEWMERKAL